MIQAKPHRDRDACALVGYEALRLCRRFIPFGIFGIRQRIEQLRKKIVLLRNFIEQCCDLLITLRSAAMFQQV